MAQMNRGTVVGVFERREHADQAVAELHRAGFRDEDIGFAVRGGDAPEGATDATQTQAGEGAATGLLTGGVIGGIVGAAAAGLIPGIGPVIAGGVLASVLGGAAVGAAAGGLLGALMGLGVPEEEARYYETEFEAGRTIVTVRAGERFNEADEILRSLGAYDVRQGSAPFSQESDSPTKTGAAAGVRDDDVSRQKAFPTAQSRQTAGPGRSSSWDEVAPTYRDAWERQHGQSGRRWQDEEAGYRFGYEMSHDPRFSDRDWRDAETDLSTEYEEWSRRRGYHASGASTWEHVRGRARGTWESLRQTIQAR